MKLGTILFPFFCLFLSFTILLTDSAFTTGLLENKDAILPTQELQQYFLHGGEMPDVFNVQERSHLIDVKAVIFVSFILLGILTYFLLSTLTKHVALQGTILLFVLLVLAAVIPFDTLFTTFHHIAFPQGNWQFAATSTLISFYPASFFITYAKAIAFHSVVVAGTLILVTKRG